MLLSGRDRKKNHRLSRAQDFHVIRAEEVEVAISVLILGNRDSATRPSLTINSAAILRRWLNNLIGESVNLNGFVCMVLDNDINMEILLEGNGIINRNPCANKTKRRYGDFTN